MSAFSLLRAAAVAARIFVNSKGGKNAQALFDVRISYGGASGQDR